MDEADRVARAVLDALVDNPRCPKCDVVSRIPWRMLDGYQVGICQTHPSVCPVVYFRRDGECILVGGSLDDAGHWMWDMNNDATRG